MDIEDQRAQAQDRWIAEREPASEGQGTGGWPSDRGPQEGDSGHTVEDDRGRHQWVSGDRKEYQWEGENDWNKQEGDRESGVTRW